MTSDMDAAHKTLGGGWHIPSETDFDELFSHCKGTYCFTFVDDTVVKGVLLEGVNGNSIFLSINRICETRYSTSVVKEHLNPISISIPDQFFNIESELLGNELGQSVNIKNGDITCIHKTYEGHKLLPIRPVTKG